MVVLEKVKELLQGRIVLQLESVPERPFRLAVLLFCRGDGLGEAKEWQGEVDETVLVIFQLVLAIDDLRLSLIR